MKDFEYMILLSDVDNIHLARRWCEEHFGKQDVIHLTYKSKKQNRIVHSHMVYDLENNRWHHRAVGSKRYNPKSFHFKNGIDAMAFKLRWI